MPERELEARQKAAESALVQAGITFNVYSDNQGCGEDSPLRFDSPNSQLHRMGSFGEGLETAHPGIESVYRRHLPRSEILKDGALPREVVLSSKGYRSQCAGLRPPRGIWCHITGTDLVRHRDGQIYVLEDNLRCPSGVSYVLENRRLDEKSVPRGVCFCANPARIVTTH